MGKTSQQIVDFCNFAAKRLDEARALEDPVLLEVAQEVAIRARTTEAIAAKLNKPYLGLRCFMLVSFAIVIGLLGWFATAIHLELEVKTWKELLELCAHLAHMSLVLPLILSTVLVERKLRRARQLKEIAELERLNDTVYAVQFDHNPFGGPEAVAQLLKYLDVCAGLLFLLREATGLYARGVSDQIVLDRVGNVRRGMNDNHRNLLAKMGMAKASASPVVM